MMRCIIRSVEGILNLTEKVQDLAHWMAEAIPVTKKTTLVTVRMS